MNKFMDSYKQLNKYLEELRKSKNNVSYCNWEIIQDNYMLEHYIINGKAVIFQVYKDGNGFSIYQEVEEL